MAALYVTAGALLSPALMNMQGDLRWALLLVPVAFCLAGAAALEQDRR
jgi:hypothetical protein